MKQLVFDSDSVIFPEQIKLENGFLNASIVATNTDSGVILQEEKSSANMNDSSRVVSGNDNFVTLHIGEDENMVVNEFDTFNQNEEISKLFKQVYALVFLQFSNEQYYLLLIIFVFKNMNLRVIRK